MRVGLVGCGNIGADICIGLQKGSIPAEIAALSDVDDARAKLLLRSFRLNADVRGRGCGAGPIGFRAELIIFALAIRDCTRRIAARRMER
jgi:hypothetical protein